MPSLHLVVALLVAASVWPLGWSLRIAGVAFIALTVLATLGFGEHYAIDLLLAIPFAAAVWLAVHRRRMSALLCASATALPLLLIRLTAGEVFP
jgi:hypothetical protein